MFVKRNSIISPMLPGLADLKIPANLLGPDVIEEEKEQSS